MDVTVAGLVAEFPWSPSRSVRFAWECSGAYFLAVCPRHVVRALVGLIGIGRPSLTRHAGALGHDRRCC